MLGLRPVSMEMPGMDFDTVRSGLPALGYREVSASDGEALFEKPGARFAVTPGQAPIKVWLQADEHETDLTLKYGAPVLLDAGGRLEREADRLWARLWKAQKGEEPPRH